MGVDMLIDLIDSGQFFQFSGSMAEVIEKRRWLYALANYSESRIMLHNLELYWDGGDTSPINKREALISMFVGTGELKNAKGGAMYLPNPETSDLDEVSFHQADDSMNYHGIVESADPESEVIFPIQPGKTPMDPLVILEPGEIFFIGAESKSKVSGNLSLIGKGYLYDKEEDVSTDPGLKVAQ